MGPAGPPAAQQLPPCAQHVNCGSQPSMFGMHAEPEHTAAALQLGAPSVASTTVVRPESAVTIGLIATSVAAVGVLPSGKRSLAARKPSVVGSFPPGSPGDIGKTWPPTLHAVASLV